MHLFSVGPGRRSSGRIGDVVARTISGHFTETMQQQDSTAWMPNHPAVVGLDQLWKAGERPLMARGIAD